VDLLGAPVWLGAVFPLLGLPILAPAYAAWSKGLRHDAPTGS